MFFTNNTILRTIVFCAIGASNGILLTSALVSDLAGGEGGVSCSSLSLVLRGFAAPSWALRLNSSAALRAPRVPSSGNAKRMLSMWKRKHSYCPLIIIIIIIVVISGIGIGGYKTRSIIRRLNFARIRQVVIHLHCFLFLTPCCF